MIETDTKWMVCNDLNQMVWAIFKLVLVLYTQTKDMDVQSLQTGQWYE